MIHFIKEGQSSELGLNISWAWYWIKFQWVWYSVERRELSSRSIRFRRLFWPSIIVHRCRFSVVDDYLSWTDLVLITHEQAEDLGIKAYLGIASRA